MQRAVDAVRGDALDVRVAHYRGLMRAYTSVS